MHKDKYFLFRLLFYLKMMIIFNLTYFSILGKERQQAMPAARAEAMMLSSDEFNYC